MVLLCHLPQPRHGNCHFLDQGVQPIIIQKRSRHVPSQLHICKCVRQGATLEGDWDRLKIGLVIMTAVTEAVTPLTLLSFL